MEQNLDNKIDFKSKILSFYKENKLKIYLCFVGLIISIISVVFLQISKKNKANLISEQYMEAGIFYNLNKKKKSKKIYENILNSKNTFYSTLALNNLLEKNLENDKKKIMGYFDIVEKLQKDKQQKDILKFKKALYLMKNSENQDANKLLNELINTNSKIKDLAEEILVK